MHRPQAIWTSERIRKRLLLAPDVYRLSIVGAKTSEENSTSNSHAGKSRLIQTTILQCYSVKVLPWLDGKRCRARAPQLKLGIIYSTIF
jgi:hypothetical protein